MPTNLEHRRAIDTAANMYLAHEPLDMSLLAERLAISRATLYRWVGNHDELLATVLAEATERAYRTAIAQASGQGLQYILDFFRRIMHSVESSSELHTLTKREPLVFIKLTMTPGAVESIAASITAEILQSQIDTGQLAITLPTQTLAEALVHICNVHLYAPLLGGQNAETETALDLIALLLAHST